ncbi:MAG: isopeptide-forming domain-containing fimbrial protein, partial [Dokdonella sp.]|nr:isopeptide-forming domain-containing fimbrial protein [Dokdonella sp.]
MTALAVLLGLGASGAALAEGSRTLHPATGPGSTGNRGVMDLSNGLYAGVARQRQFLYVYAQAGEVILLGSRNRSNGGDVLVYNPQSFGARGNETIPAASNFSCASQAGRGTIANRAQELAGPNSADLTATVPNGFAPCWYVAPSTGIYGVRFTAATSGNQTNTADIADPRISTSLVSAWDVTVRANVSSLADLNGRVFTYAWAIYLNANGRVITNDLHYVSSDGFRYRQTFRGLDPNRAVFYANPKGFIDAGAPLYHDLRGNSAEVNAGPSFTAGVTAEAPTYPMFFSDVAPAGPNAVEVNRVLSALAIALVPQQPQLSAPTFVGNAGGYNTTVNSGGVFTFTTLNTLTYEIVIRRGSVGPGADPNHPPGCVDDYDPANVCNRVLTGVALSGNHAILWNGLDNAGFAFPVGSFDFQIVGRNGEIHFPMVDVEGNANGGPSLIKLNPFNAAEAATVYYDDRGYRTAGGTLIGDLNGHLCGAGNAEVQPTPTHSLTGVDATNANLGGSGHYYRYWTGSSDPNTDCDNSAATYFGTAKALDLWALERSPIIHEPVVIIPPTVGVDVGTMVSVTPAVLAGDTAYGSFTFTNAGDTTATGVTYSVALGNPGVPATCPTSVNFTLVPAGVTATYNPAPACTITFTGMPTSLTPGQSLNFNFNYVVLPTNPGPIPITTNIAAANENNNVAPNTATAQTVVAKPVITLNKSAVPAPATLVNVGDTITYTVSVAIANAPLTSVFTLSDALGTGLTFGSVSAQSPQFSCSGSLTCTLPIGTGIGTYTVTYTASVNAAASGTVANNVTGSGGGGDSPPTCTTCSVIHTLVNPALGVVKSVTSGAGPYAEGETISYSLVVSNEGNV